MLRKHSNIRSLQDNLKLGAITAVSAGMVNVSSVSMFFAFTSNITGHYAILADEISSGRYEEIIIVASWLFLFFMGSFVSNYIIINSKLSRFVAHSIPLVLEMLILIGVGFYGIHYYQETLSETEVLVALLLFTMGLQNGLTATISNFAVKTTHLTGLTTDLAIYTSMYLNSEYRKKPIVKEKIRLFLTIMICYVGGGILAGMVTHKFGFYIFPVIAGFMSLILVYDYLHIKYEQKKMEEIRMQRSEPEESKS